MISNPTRTIKLTLPDDKSTPSTIPSTASREALVDIGLNLTHDSFDEDRQQVLQRALHEGIRQMVVTGASIDGSEDAVMLANHHECLFATVGIHPHHAQQTNNEALERFKKLSQDHKVKAIGETGLDFFRDFSPRDTQVRSFEQHIDLATQLGLPMFLHERDAHPTLAEVLKPHRDSVKDIVVHCFTGEKEALHAYLDLGCYIGITGWICDERRGLHLADLVRDIPSDRLMLETDSPYLMPRNIRPKPKSRRNEPHYLTRVCEFTAAVLDIPYNDLACQTTENARRFFSLPAP
ncbi:MAG: hydrolase TatD [Gammaproteobacteria bacterium]|jgi:TatD DNase family protein|nr:hydrolase TatD [Gammaproteobacteria bacterium]|tara:strand:- start:4765 stop:5643 length:879 start_codon:yes stop_codon:yes gene_type:complete